MIEAGHPALSVRRQCELLGLSRSSLYYVPAGESDENLRLMRLIDEQYTACPFYGRRRMTMWLVEGGEEVWLGPLGPAVPPMGVVKGGAALIQAQVAATLAALVGAHWTGVNAPAAPPVDFRSYTPSASTLEHP